MSLLQEFVDEVTRQARSEPDTETITVRRRIAEAAAESLAKKIKSARKGGLRGKGGRRPVLTDPAAIKNRDAVRRHRDRKRKK